MAGFGSAVAFAFWPALFAFLVGMAVKPWRNTR